MISKKTLLTLFICCTACIAKAQLGYNFSQYDIGVAAGFNKVYGDAQTQKMTPSIHFNLTYNQTPYTNFVFEGQFGRLEGGDSIKDSFHRQFVNNYAAFIFRGQLQAGELIDYSQSRLYNGLKNLYLSTGIGYVINHITSISRTLVPQPAIYATGSNNSNEIFIPVKIGYEFKIFDSYQQPAYKIDIGYQANFVLGDNLDGYTQGKSNDVFTQFTIGVKIAIGNGATSYRKQIQY